MPGCHVTDQQTRLFMKLRQTHPIEVAAAKADFSRSTGFRIAQDPRLPSQKIQPRERRRPDPLEAIFDAEVVPCGASASRWTSTACRLRFSDTSQRQSGMATIAPGSITRLRIHFQFQRG